MYKLISYLRAHWLYALLAPLLMLLEVCMDLLQPILMASIIDRGVMEGDFSHIRSTGLIMLGAALVGLVGGFGCTVFSSIAAQRFGADLRHDTFKKVQTFSFRNLDQLTTGSLITRLTGDIVQLQTMVQMLLRIFVRSPLLAIGSIVMAILISPKLALILAVAVPLLFIVMLLLIRATLPLFSKVQQRMDKVNTVLQENLGGIRVSKAFVRKDFEEQRFGAANRDYTAVGIKAQRLVAVNMPILTMILNLSIIAVLLLGGRDVIGGSFEVGQLVAFINYVTQVLFALSSVAMMLVRISSAKVSADRIQEILGTEPDIASAELPHTPVSRNGSVTFENVSFHYDANSGHAALRDISFTVASGEKIGIVGATGSGKSSLVNLIPRLYDASEGRVLVDGIDVRSYDLNELRTTIGIILQETILFSGSIRDNITFGRPDAAEDEILAAAKAAQAHDFICALKDGYDTMLGQRGINLSGGQKQRLSIARAFIQQPDLLIMDDSTSAIDMGTEFRLQAALASFMKGKTTIMIAQRLSSVMDADRILVLEEGRLAAQGTHEELMAACDIYRDIYRSQHGGKEHAYG